MRILINALTIDRGGRLIYFNELLPELEKFTPEHEFFIVRHAEHEGYIDKIPDSFQVITVRFSARPKFRRIIWEQYGIPRIMRRYKIDAAFFPSPLTTMFSPAPYLMDLRDSNLIYSVPGLNFQFRIRNKIGSLIMHQVAKRAYRIMFVSDFSRNVAVARLSAPQEKTVVTYPNIPAYNFRDHKNSRSVRLKKIDSPFLLTVSTIQPHKNYPRAIRAFIECCKDPEFNWDYVLVGEAASSTEKKKIDKLLNESEFSDRIHLLGAVPNKELPAIYQHASAYFSPFLLEAFCRTIVEAMAAGLPILAANNTSMPEIAGRLPIFFDPFKVEEMHIALMEIWGDAALRKEMAAKSREQALKYQFSNHAEVIVKNLVDAVRNAG
jgi:glycosyltransferase involved in cell wall biosynthesis